MSRVYTSNYGEEEGSGGLKSNGNVPPSFPNQVPVPSVPCLEAPAVAQLFPPATMDRVLPND